MLTLSTNISWTTNFEVKRKFALDVPVFVLEMKQNLAPKMLRFKTPFNDKF